MIEKDLLFALDRMVEAHGFATQSGVRMGQITVEVDYAAWAFLMTHRGGFVSLTGRREQPTLIYKGVIKIEQVRNYATPKGYFYG